MTKLEKILTLMRYSKDECEVFIKCYDVNRFIHINEIIAEFNDCLHPDASYLFLKYNDCINRGNEHIFISLKKSVSDKEVISVKFYDMCESSVQNIYQDTDVLQSYKSEHKNPNLDAMLSNLFGTLNEIVENKQTKSNKKGNKVKDVLKVFDKGKVDVKQIIVQMYLKDLTSNVPFVNELVRKELARIKNEIATGFTPIHNLDTYNLKFLASVDYLEDIKNCDSVVDLECAYMFYVYEKEIAKELRLLGKPDYSWIKDFLIQKNVMSSKRVDLFKSKKFEIFIEDGSIHLVDVKPNIIYSLDIKYNEEEKTFHL